MHDDLASLGVKLVTVGSLLNVAEYTHYAYFNVVGPPVIGECSFRPQNPDAPLIALESNFTFECSPSPSLNEGPVRYSVYCNASSVGADSPEDPQLYSDFYPTASNIVMPVDTCDSYALLGNAYNLTSTKSLGKFSLTSPIDIVPPENTTDPEQVLANILQEVSAIGSPNASQADIEPVKKAVIISQATTRVNRVLLNKSTAATQEEASRLLSAMSQQLLNMTYEDRDPVLEIYLRNSSKHALEAVSTVMQLQTKQPNATEEDKANLTRVANVLKNTVSTISNVLLNRTNVGEDINVSTPILDMRVWRAQQNDTVGKAMQLRNITVEMPEGVGEEGVISMAAVATTINPEPSATVKHATNFLNITFGGTGVDKQDFTVSYSFPRNTPVVEDEDSPYVILFNLSGEAHCVRYDTARRLYGWRVLSDSAAMSIDIPSGGRAFITVSSNVSLYLQQAVHRVDLMVNNETVGKICWPLLKETSYSSIKLRRHVTDDNQEELWVENGRPAMTHVGLGFWISYTNLTGVDPPLDCDASLAREGTQVYPVNSSVRLLQMIGQCLVYDVQLRKFVHNTKCKAYPGKDSVRCECSGASLHTAVDPPVTNTLDFKTLHIDLQDNPVPLIFSVVVSCLFLFLCIVGVVQDILSKKKLSPLVDTAKVDRPVMYNVFVYTSKFRCSRVKANLKFSLTLRGSGGNSATNTFTSPGVLHGAMLHLLLHADQQLGALRAVMLIPRDDAIKWHVSRVVVSDAVQREVVVFRVNAWVRGGAKSVTRMPEADRNMWRENFLVQVTSDIMEAIPVLMLLLPGRVQERKLDHMLTYALSLMIWALIQLWFYEAVHPMYRPDDCIKAVVSASQAALNSAARMLINMALLVFSSILIETTIGKSLMYKEVKSDESRSWAVGGLLPLPHWVRLAVRVVASLAVVTTIAFLTFMAYMFSRAEFNVWLFDMAKAFAIQIFTKAVKQLVACAVRYLLYLPSPDKFTEDMLNPEGVRVPCPKCGVCPRVLHQHFADHLSVSSFAPRRDWLPSSFGSSSMNGSLLLPL